MEHNRRFTNRQVVTMVMAVCAALVLAPVGAVAATGSLVNITDPVQATHKARVDAAGRLVTAPCDGDSCAAVDGNSLRVGGTVNSRQSAPKSVWHAMKFVNGYVVLVGPTSSAIDVTSLTVTPVGNGANFGLLPVTVPSSASSCTPATGPLAYYLPQLAANQAFTASFPTPLRVYPAAGHKMCLYASTGVGGTLWVNLSGYLG